jgi:hypothetical protein
MDLKRGDLIEVKWLDITEDPVGNPSEAKLPTRHSVGYFWGATESTFTTTMTMDDDVEEQSGYCIYPLGVIVGIKRIRKGKGKKYASGRLVRVEYPQRPSPVNTGTDPDLHTPEAVGVGGAAPGQRS